MPIVSSEWTIHRFLSHLASERPAPGGGAAAALAGAMGAALGSMVCRLVASRRRVPAGRRPLLHQRIRQLERARRALEQLIAEDAQAYQAWSKALARGRGIPTARYRATAAPVEICEAVAGAISAMERLEPLAGSRLACDVRVARGLLRGAFRAAWATARANLRQRQQPGGRQERWLAARLEKVSQGVG